MRLRGGHVVKVTRYPVVAAGPLVAYGRWQRGVDGACRLVDAGGCGNGVVVVVVPPSFLLHPLAVCVGVGTGDDVVGAVCVSICGSWRHVIGVVRPCITTDAAGADVLRSSNVEIPCQFALATLSLRYRCLRSWGQYRGGCILRVRISSHLRMYLCLLLSLSRIACRPTYSATILVRRCHCMMSLLLWKHPLLLQQHRLINIRSLIRTPQESLRDGEEW